MSGAVYRSADIRMWGDEKVMALSVNAERIWTWLLIGPHTTAVPGLVVATRAGMAERMRMPLRSFDRAFVELIDAEMADADWKAGVIVLPKAPVQDVNRCQSTSTAVAWAKVFSQFAPQCDLTRRYRSAIIAALNATDAAFALAFETQSRGHYRKPQASKSPARSQGDATDTQSDDRGHDRGVTLPLHGAGDQISKTPNDSAPRSISSKGSANCYPNGSPEQDPGTRTDTEDSPRGTASPPAPVQQGLSAVQETKPPAPSSQSRPTKPSVAQVIQLYVTRWMEVHRPDDGKPPKLDNADRMQAVALVRDYGVELALQYVERFMDDAEPWLFERRHPLSLIKRQINRYRGTTATPAQAARLRANGPAAPSSYPGVRKIAIVPRSHA